MAKVEIRDLKKTYSEGNLADKVLAPININPLAVLKQMGVETESNTPPQGDFHMEGFNLIIPDGKTMAILGPSGCGKSTLLRMLAGIETSEEGEILFDGEDVSALPPRERGIGMVFQNYALFPHFKAKTNILTNFLFRKHESEQDLERDKEAQEKMEYVCQMLGVEMKHLLERSPSKLSGGEKQRVALGRCIARNPRLFLLDEPLSSLDAPLREKYRIEIKHLLSKFNITTVYVTHDQNEALVLGDLISIMREGRIEQSGTFKELYDHPVNKFVAKFLNPQTDTPAINLLDNTPVSKQYPGAIIGVRPENIKVHFEPTEEAIEGDITFVLDVGVRKVLNIRTSDGQEISAPVPAEATCLEGDKTWLSFDYYHVFERESGKCIHSEGK